MSKSTIIAALVAVGAISLTGCGSNSAQPAAQPTVTTTKTVTKTVTKEVTPQACKDLLRALPAYANAVQRFGSNAAQWPPLVAKAYGAGISGDPNQATPILAKMRSLTDDLHRQDHDLGPIVNQIKSLGRECNSH